MLFLLIFSNMFSFKSYAAQSQLTGSAAALGSPLTSDTFTIENWNTWEMLCFGIFLSNFCQPFEDDYNSAFTEGSSTGTQGRGLKALQFAAGGDVDAAGYLHDMVEYCKNAQATPYKKIYVNYSYYEYNQEVAGSSLTGTSRVAYFDDLLPVLSHFNGEDKIKLRSNNLIEQPIVSYSLYSEHIVDYLGNLLDTVAQKTYVEYAVLPTFYIDSNASSSESIIFDMTDNWDIQILKALFAKAFNKNAASNYVASETEGMDKSLDDELKKYMGQTCPLVMDTFGNICMMYQNRQIILIPASANSHITADGSTNYVNSLILNNYALGSKDVDTKVIAQSVEEFVETHRGGILGVGSDALHRVGNFPISPNSKSEITPGRILITSDTDTDFFYNFYDYCKSVSPKADVSYQLTDAQEGDADYAYQHGTTMSWDEAKLGHSIHNLYDKNSFKNQPLQLHITGANSVVVDEECVWWFGGGKRDESQITVDTTLGAYGLLSTLFATSGNNKSYLDYIYIVDSSKTLEDTKVQIFGEHYYLSPHIPIDEQATKLYLNSFSKTIDGSKTVDGVFSTIFTNEYRNALFDKLDTLSEVKQITGILVSEDAIYNDNYSLSDGVSNPIYKTFLNHYYTMKNNKYNVYSSSTSKISEVNSAFDLGEPKISEYELGDVPSKALGTFPLTRLVKVYKPGAEFSAIASIFSLDEGSNFETYSNYIYITYLDFYGLLGGKNSHNFNEALFDGATFKTFTGEDFTNGLTEEQMESEVKLNVFKLLSLNKEGETYRKNLFESIIKTTFVEPLDEAMQKGGIGNVGAETNFLDVSYLEDNFLIGDMIKDHWAKISLVLFGLLSIIAIVSGALNNKSIGWYLAILLASSSMVYSIPYYLNIAPIVVEKYINGHFRNTGSYWALSESIELDKNTADLADSGNSSSRAIAMLNTLNFLDTDSSLMVKLDISQKVLSKTAIDYSELQRLTTTRWLLPSLMQQMSSTKDRYDYVSVPVTRLYNNYARIWIMYNGESDYIPVYPDGGVDAQADHVDMALVDKEGSWAGYKSTAASTSLASETTKSISRLTSVNSEPTHTNFYMLKDTKITSVYNLKGATVSDPSLIGGMSRKDWEEYSKSVERHSAGEDGIDVGIQTDLFKQTSQNMLDSLNTYNQYEDKISQEFGYLWTTENLGTYFYTLVKDTFMEADSGKGKNVAYVVLQLQGDTATNDAGQEVRKSFMHYGETGYERDVCDMEEVFTNLMPYMYQTMVLANGNTDHTGLLGDAKMSGNDYYSENYQSWMFRSNWITKIYEDNLYAGSAKVISRDENGNESGSYLVENVLDPRCYPAERPMVFSEAQMYEQNLTKKDLTFTELKILEFNSDVIRRWTTLINYANTDGLEKEHIYRQMAIEALFAFSETFTRDNVIMTAKTMYPTNFDLRNLSLITIIRSLVCNLTRSNSYMYGDVAVSLYQTYGFFLGFIPIWLIYHSMLAFGSIRDIYMIAAFISAIATLALNFGSTSKEKMKSMFGWVITSALFCFITIGYYWIINFLVGNPTVDTLVNFNTVTSSRLSSVFFGFWGFMIFLLTVLYAVIIVTYFYQLWIGHKFGLNIKDGGFGFYYQLADKAASTIVGATRKLGHKLGSGMNHISGNLKQYGPGATPDKKQKVKAELDGGSGGVHKSKPKDTKNENELVGSDLNGNFNNGTATSGENKEVTDTINNQIKASKKADASYENAKKADIEIVNNTDINIKVVEDVKGNLDNSTTTDKSEVTSSEINNRVRNEKLKSEKK